VLFVNERLVLGCIVGAQLTEDAQKLFSWPAYSVGARSRYRCPFVLIVVTPDERVARWAGQLALTRAGVVPRPEDLFDYGTIAKQ